MSLSEQRVTGMRVRAAADNGGRFEWEPSHDFFIAGSKLDEMNGMLGASAMNTRGFLRSIRPFMLQARPIGMAYGPYRHSRK